MSTASLTNTDKFGDVLLRGRPISKEMRKRLLSANIEMTSSEASQLSFDISDPGFSELSKGTFNKLTPITYRNLSLQISVVETKPGGRGVVGITCRPSVIWKLKQLRGHHVVANTTPSAFVAGECSAAGVSAVIQPGNAPRRNIMRDVPQKGQDYDETSYPSAWTTMQRLASDVGYVLYECGGTIYFGQPTWLVARNPKFAVHWYPEDGAEPMAIPTVRDSVDSKDITIDFVLPIKRAGLVMPGYGLVLTGFPQYSGTYFTTSVSYPLVGAGQMQVSCSTLRNPKPQTNSSNADYKTIDSIAAGGS